MPWGGIVFVMNTRRDWIDLGEEERRWKEVEPRLQRRKSPLSIGPVKVFYIP